jgi:beta-ribofuranosylaminobenzene 5'-phosphate synthase
MEGGGSKALSNSMRVVTVIAGSRIHISLADLGLVSRRTYGGVGFMLDRPGAVVEVQDADLTVLNGMEGLDEVARREIAALVSRLTSDGDLPAQVSIKQHAPQHVGLGSKTAIQLSIIAAFDRLREMNLGRERQQLLSGRGGTSGIGIHGFFEGGVIWDVGRAREDVSELLPSSAVKGATALLMARIPFPEAWHVGLALTPGPIIHGPEEVRFVKDRTPVSEIDALRTIAELTHGVLPAFRTQSLTTLAEVLSDLSSHGFKLEEVKRCGDAAKLLLAELQGQGHACGISSVGPTLYVIALKTDDTAACEIEATCGRHGSEWLGFFDGLNEPAKCVLE